VGGCDLDECTVDACVAGSCALVLGEDCTRCNTSCRQDGAAPPSSCECRKFGDDLLTLGQFDAIEFCVPRAGDAEAQVETLLAGLRCMDSRGRIGCDLGTQRLCLWEPVEPGHDPLLSCGNWAALCAVSRLRAVQAIRGTWFE